MCSGFGVVPLFVIYCLQQMLPFQHVFIVVINSLKLAFALIVKQKMQMCLVKEFTKYQALNDSILWKDET